MRRAIVFATAEAAEEAFYDAMQRGDAQGMMALWADDDDVTCVHPNGPRLVGIDAIRTAFEHIFAHGGVTVRVSDVRVHQGAVVAVHNLIEQVAVAGRRGSEVVDCSATNVYVKTANGWRIVLHHASPVSEGGAAAEGSAGSAVLH
ncbi:MAG: SgcJ/EcaC family oxidoreductase [Burkholderiaceae bacterium]|nr:SgcJ/EcaC family oxidoreductase [Burkholderiaceae bacterium]